MKKYYAVSEWGLEPIYGVDDRQAAEEYIKRHYAGEERVSLLVQTYSLTRTEEYQVETGE